MNSRHRLFCALAAISMVAQAKPKEESKIAIDFYGNVRTEISYNSRACVGRMDDNFYLYPQAERPDALGEDLNAIPNGTLYALSTRMGVNVSGVNVLNAKGSAKVETDFAGFGGNAMLRLRHAYFNLAWEDASLLVGQTFHPLFGDIFPTMLNLSTGAPFQPFNRSPMIRYRYNPASELTLTAAAIYQYMSLSPGPIGSSSTYMRNSCLPELYAGIDYNGESGWSVGLGGDMLSLKPRTQSVINNQTYKVDERITSYSADLHLRYKQPNYTIAAKSIYGNNLAHTVQIGGYGISSIDSDTGAREYTPFTVWSNWINATYGTTYQVGIFGGYLTNMGTIDPLAITSEVYGNSPNIDHIITGMVSFTYNQPHFKLGVELSRHAATYGEIAQSGQIINLAPAVNNNRIQAIAMYIF